MSSNPIKTRQFARLQTVPGLRHAVTTRSGGVSNGGFDSLNLGLHVGDDPEAVRENRRRLASQMGYDATTLVAAQQVHGREAALVDSTARGRGALDYADALSATDAIIVADVGLPAMVLVADCAPLLFADPVGGCFALVHAGWRGAVSRIASRTVKKMESELGVRAADLLVGLGPHLCTGCFEIGSEVAEVASAQCAEAVVSPVVEAGGRPHLDLNRLLLADLEAAGVRGHSIESMSNCPRCNNDQWFSHRAQGGNAGRFGLVAFRLG